jgi:amino acid adenylation domain-containing protein
MTTRDGKLTYAEVDARATAIARGLVRCGAKAGEVVGLWLERGIDVLISQIAIAKTGATWLPLDSDAPVERIAACLGDASARLLLADTERVRRAIGVLRCPAIDPAGIVDAADQSGVDARALGATPDHAAYIIYTSGSTGEPKGIVVSNRNICHFLRAVNEVYGVTGKDVMFQGASVAFDLSVEQIWLPYMVGASLFVADAETIYEIDELPGRLERAGVTVLDTLPTLLAALPRDVETLRIIILGGEACTPAIVERWAREGRALYNTYGPTEATVVATASQLRRGEDVTIGRPIPNYSCYVVDTDLVAVGVGVEGEFAHRRSGRRQRLSRTRRFDSAQIHRESLQKRRLRSDSVSHWRRRGNRGLRKTGLQAAYRRSDQDPWLSRRTRRDRRASVGYPWGFNGRNGPA